MKSYNVHVGLVKLLLFLTEKSRDLPTSAGNGGFNRGFPCFPSKLSISALTREIQTRLFSPTIKHYRL